MTDSVASFSSSRVDRPLHGRVRVPGDKSISHRAVMFGALAEGVTRIEGLLDSEDVQSTMGAMLAMGARVEQDGEIVSVRGVGAAGLKQPSAPMDMGNSGTSTRLLMGIVAGHDVRATFFGDASLSKRPMGRVLTPLTQMGLRIEDSNDGKLPLTVRGTNALTPITYTLPVASAQVKSAVLLAGLRAHGTTTVIENEATRDHTERMLRGFGVPVTVDGNSISITGPTHLTAPTAPVVVPSDPSSAAFPMVAAAIVAGSCVTITGVCLNPTRTGALLTLREMGADITIENERDVAGETVGDITVRGGALRAVHTPASRAPSMIDEYPILSVAAAVAHGTTRFEGLAELRVKESDRLASIARGLSACGVTCREGDDWLEIDGSAGALLAGGATIATNLDHRLAMSFAVLGAVAQSPVTIDDARPIATSFPTFLNLMGGIGLRLS